MNAHEGFSAQLVLPQKVLCPLLLGCREKDFAVEHFGRRRDTEERKQVQIVFDAVLSIILFEGQIGEPIIQASMVFIAMAEALWSVNESGDDAVMDFALRIGVNGNVIAELPQPPKEKYSSPPTPNCPK